MLCFHPNPTPTGDRGPPASGSPTVDGDQGIRAQFLHMDETMENLLYFKPSLASLIFIFLNLF